MSFTSAPEFLNLYFGELDQRGIPYVILHSYEKLPEGVESDIDYAVEQSNLPKLNEIQKELCEVHNWRLVQSLQHGVCAFYNILISLDDPSERLELDACSHYTRARHLFVKDSFLLEGRRKHGPYSVPKPAAEFIYVMTKLFDAKNKNPKDYIGRLEDLFRKDPEGAREAFKGVFQDTPYPLDEWFQKSPSEWSELRKILLRRNLFGPRMLASEFLRVARRILNPTGLFVSIDQFGSLISEDTKERILSCQKNFFRRTYQLPILVINPTPVENEDGDVNLGSPQGKKRGFLSSLSLLVSSYLKYWKQYFSNVWPGRISSSFILADMDLSFFHRYPGRFNLSGNSAWVARILAALAPRPDLRFCAVVEASPADVISGSRTKPEGSLGILERGSPDHKVALKKIELVETKVVNSLQRQVIDILARRI